MPFLKSGNPFGWFFFSRYDCWYHVLSMPIWLPIGNYYFIGPRYFTDSRVFWWGTLLEMACYWFSVFTFRQVIGRIFRAFPDLHQTPARTAVILLTLGAIMVVQATVYVYLFSLFPLFEAPFQWSTVRSIMVIGLCFNVFFCIVLSGAYLYRQWQDNQQEREQLKRAALQHQFDQLKGQVNPDFLFHSLGSLTDLIGKDTAQAEKFVEELAKVYRYLLRAHQQPLVSLAEELTFARSYARLLGMRYPAADVSLDGADDLDRYLLPPLTLQVLLDHAVKHYLPLDGTSLPIRVVVRAGQLRVTYPVAGPTQAETPALTSLVANHQLLGGAPVEIHSQEGHCTVQVPLLAASTTFVPQQAD
jgi:hypothetical protein